MAHHQWLPRSEVEGPTVQPILSCGLVAVVERRVLSSNCASAHHGVPRTANRRVNRYGIDTEAMLSGNNCSGVVYKIRLFTHHGISDLDWMRLDGAPMDSHLGVYSMPQRGLEFTAT